MQGLIWTTILWAAALGFARSSLAPATLRNLSAGLHREHTAIVLLLLSTHAASNRAGAEDTLANPFIAETLARGGLAFLAMIIIIPMFMPKARMSLVVRGRRYGVFAFGLYALVAIFSVLYSVAPFVTAGKAYEIALIAALAWVLVTRSDAVDAIKRTILLVIYLEGFLLAVAILGFVAGLENFHVTLRRRGFVFRDTMTTRFGGPNSFAAFGGLLTAFGLAAYYEAKSRNVLHARRWLTVPAVGTLGVIGASGRQGVAIWLAAVAIVLFIYRRQIFLVLVAPAAVAFAVLYFDSIFDVLSRGQYENSLNTLTGRTTFWAAGVDAFEQRPVTGYGFGAGSRFVALKAIDKDQFTHLHNGFLEALTGVGIVGFLPFVYATGRAVTWSAVRLLRGVGVTFAILMVPLFLQNMVGLGFGAWLNENVILFALVVALADAEGIIPRRVRSPARLPMYR